MNPLKQYRHAKKISQSQLAKILGISQPVIALIETGKRKIPSEKAVIWSQMIPEWDIFMLRPDLRLNPGVHSFMAEDAA